MSLFSYKKKPKADRNDDDFVDPEVAEAQSASMGAIWFNVLVQLTWVAMILMDPRSPFILEPQFLSGGMEGGNQGGGVAVVGEDPAARGGLGGGAHGQIPQDGTLDSQSLYDWAHLSWYIAALLLYNITHFRAWAMNPGFIKGEREYRKKKKVKKPTDAELVRADGQKLRWCDTCHVIQPLRTRHCNKCGFCVRKFDHHCFWMGGCVGERNHREFTHVLMTAFLYVSWSCILSFDFVSVTFDHTLQQNWDENWISLPLCIIAVSVTFFVLALLLLHFYLVFSSQTTWEALSRDKVTYIREYHAQNNMRESGIPTNRSKASSGLLGIFVPPVSRFPFDHGGACINLRKFYCDNREKSYDPEGCDPETGGGGIVWTMNKEHNSNCMDCIV